MQESHDVILENHPLYKEVLRLQEQVGHLQIELEFYKKYYNNGRQFYLAVCNLTDGTLMPAPPVDTADAKRMTDALETINTMIDDYRKESF
jgi:hypothetical protein